MSVIPLLAPGLEILGALLKIWNHKEANKYRDRFERYSRKLYEEYQKNENERDSSVISDCEFELYLLGQGVVAEIGRSEVRSPK